MAPFRAKINPDHFGADINNLFIIKQEYMKPAVKASNLNASELARDVSVLGRKIPVEMMTLHLLSM